MFTTFCHNIIPFGSTNISLPQGSEVVKVSQVNGTIQLWVFGDTEAGKQDRVFHVVGTGSTVVIPPGMLIYVGSVFLTDEIQSHVFEQVL